MNCARSILRSIPPRPVEDLHRLGLALADFRRSQGWAAGADLKYATPEQGASIGKDTTEMDPVIALVFGQAGLIAGATLSGTKYTRIIP